MSPRVAAGRALAGLGLALAYLAFKPLAVAALFAAVLLHGRALRRRGRTPGPAEDRHGALLLLAGGPALAGFAAGSLLPGPQAVAVSEALAALPLMPDAFDQAALSAGGAAGFGAAGLARLHLGHALGGAGFMLALPFALRWLLARPRPAEGADALLRQLRAGEPWARCLFALMLAILVYATLVREAWLIGPDAAPRHLVVIGALGFWAMSALLLMLAAKPAPEPQPG